MSTPGVIEREETRREGQRAAALRAANGGRSGRQPFRLSSIWEWTKIFPAAVLLFLVIRSFFVEAYKIPSGSMERTLLVGDFLLVNKLLYGAEIPFTGKRLPAIRAPRYGDVLVFEWPVDPSKSFVKRLVGLPGDTLSMAGGVLSRNGTPQREPYVSHTDPGVDPTHDDFRWQRSYLVHAVEAAGRPFGNVYRPSRDNWGPIVVPPTHMFVLGDNRDSSLDSRYWGFVADSLLRGAPLIVYYSFTPDSTASVPWLTHIRWSRVGDVVR